jgi:hypothetical protein
VAAPPPPQAAASSNSSSRALAGAGGRLMGRPLMLPAARNEAATRAQGTAALVWYGFRDCSFWVGYHRRGWDV